LERSKTTRLGGEKKEETINGGGGNRGRTWVDMHVRGRPGPKKKKGKIYKGK